MKCNQGAGRRAKDPLLGFGQNRCPEGKDHGFVPFPRRLVPDLIDSRCRVSVMLRGPSQPAFPQRVRIEPSNLAKVEGHPSSVCK